MSRHVCLIFCSSDRISLNDAQTILEKDGLSIESRDNSLICFRDNSPRFTIRLNQEEEVRVSAKSLGEEYPNYRSRLKNCDAHFEISFANLSEVLDEVNTLIDIQIVLQDAAEGIVFTSWNGIIEV